MSSNMDLCTPKGFWSAGKSRKRKEGMEAAPINMLPPWNMFSRLLMSRANWTSFLWNRFPATKTHRILMTGILNRLWKSTKPEGFESASAWISASNSRISWRIVSSIEDLTNPRSRRCRRVKRRWSTNRSPSVNINPRKGIPLIISIIINCKRVLSYFKKI